MLTTRTNDLCSECVEQSDRVSALLLDDTKSSQLIHVLQRRGAVLEEECEQLHEEARTSQELEDAARGSLERTEQEEESLLDECQQLRATAAALQQAEVEVRSAAESEGRDLRHEVQEVRLLLEGAKQAAVVAQVAECEYQREMENATTTRLLESRTVVELQAECEKEKQASSRWRTLIIEEQERSSGLQQQLMDAGKARHEAFRKEAAKQRECDRLQRQLAGLQTTGQQSPAAAQSSSPGMDEAEELRKELMHLRTELDAAGTAASKAQVEAHERAEEFRHECERLRKEAAEAAQRQAARERDCKQSSQQLERLVASEAEAQRRAEATSQECQRLRKEAEAEGAHKVTTTSASAELKTGYNWWWK
mmetsp:Transcript_64801/g.150687  ORF Transcript_64801/g.150687 Transcript_64801/m.150687 type:complete len:366 (+) Transcript_64801:1166-2263(+)